MDSSLGALQAAIYSRLAGDTNVTSKVTGVFDEAPQNQKFPYITLGEDTATDFSSYPGANDGQEVTHTLHTWSQYRGFKEVKAIHSLIIKSLSASPLVLSSGRIVLGSLDMEQTLRDPDGITRHGVLRLRFKIQIK